MYHQINNDDEQMLINFKFYQILSSKSVSISFTYKKMGIKIDYFVNHTINCSLNVVNKNC